VTHCGNGRQDVFLVRGDREAYLGLLRKHAHERGLSILGYCIMTTHVHVVAVPEAQASLAQALGSAHSQFAQWWNWRHARSGHLWEGRFYSCCMDEGHTTAAMRYVERNPVRAGLVTEPWQYEWSSARAHVGGSDAAWILDLQAWRTRWPAEEWLEFVRTPEDPVVIGSLRSSTSRGWPLGSDEFVAGLELRLGRRLRPRSPRRS